MPVLLQTTDLQEGMRLARTLVAGNTVVFAKNAILSGKDIESLSHKYPTLQVSVEDPRLDEAITFQDDTQETRVSHHVRRQVMDTVQGAQKSLAGDSCIRGEALLAIETAIREITDFLRDNPVSWASLANKGNRDPHVPEHAGNAFYLSMILGNAVRGYFVEAAKKSRGIRENSIGLPNLSWLGLAALLMDASLWSIEMDIPYDEQLSDAERERIYYHPITSMEMLPEGTNSVVKDTIRCHHENYTGRGYPMNISGKDIPLFARILRVADAYSTATSLKVDDTVKSPVRAFWEMTCGPYEGFFDPIILKIFQSVVQPYPIGAKVRLACGRYAIVVRRAQIHGLLPEVIIAFDENNKPLPTNKLVGPLRLDSCPEVRIVSFAGEDLTDIYGDQPVFIEEEVNNTCDFATFFKSKYP